LGLSQNRVSLFLFFRRRVSGFADKNSRGRILYQETRQKAKVWIRHAIWGHILPFVVQFSNIECNSEDGEVHHHLVGIFVEVTETIVAPISLSLCCRTDSVPKIRCL
jgi:hypothetical protein